MLGVVCRDTLDILYVDYRTSWLNSFIHIICLVISLTSYGNNPPEILTLLFLPFSVFALYFSYLTSLVGPPKRSPVKVVSGHLAWFSTGTLPTIPRKT